MIHQQIDGIDYVLAENHDFDFLHRWGNVFRVFDEQDSGNICFGVEGDGGKLFIKYAGAPTARYHGDPKEAVQRLKQSEELYRVLCHPNLIALREGIAIGGGYALVFDWVPGICMGQMYSGEHAAFMALPLRTKKSIFQQIADFMEYTASRGYLAVDFYDGSILYDPEAEKAVICDIDFFCRLPGVNRMGRMWGSSRFLSPEETVKGAALDEVTNVFTLGQMAFALFTDSDRRREAWPLSVERYAVLCRAIQPERVSRYPSIRAFRAAWDHARMPGSDL